MHQSDANKFKDEFEKYKFFASSPQKPSEEDKLTEEIGKLKVDEDEQKDSDKGEHKSSESASSGEGVKEESSNAASDDAVKAEDSKKEEPQETKSATE